jgi:hypothetical protein
MLKEMVLYRKSCLLAKREHQPRPLLNDYLGSCFLQIALHLSRKPCFVGYTFREEMMSDAVENCVQYASNFNPLKSKNPFAYFTQIIYYAFLRRIAKEKKQTFIKNKIIMEMPYDAFELQAHDEDGSYANAYLDFLQNNSDFEDPYAKKKAKKLAAAKAKTLENFMDSDEIIMDDIDESKS